MLELCLVPWKRQVLLSLRIIRRQGVTGHANVHMLVDLVGTHTTHSECTSACCICLRDEHPRLHSAKPVQPVPGAQRTAENRTSHFLGCPGCNSQLRHKDPFMKPGGLGSRSRKHMLTGDRERENTQSFQAQLPLFPEALPSE